MTIQVTIEQIADNRATLRDGETVIQVPASLLPAGSTVGQTVWLSCETAAPTTPQAILNELLHPDDPQRIA